MKKLTSVLGIFVLLVFSACSTSAGELGKTSTNETSAANLGTSYKLEEFVPTINAGINLPIEAKILPEEMSVEETQDFPEALQKYTNPYPVDDNGAQYETTEELVNQNEQDLVRFLDIYFEQQGDYEFEKSIDDISGLTSFSYTGSDLSAYSRAGYLNANSSESFLMEDSTDEILLDNRLVNAAINYLDIQNPVLRNETVYNEDGTVYDYIFSIVEASSSVGADTLDEATHSITVVQYYNTEGLSVRIQKVDAEPAGSPRPIAYEEALEMVKEKYPDASVEDMRVEIYYDAQVEVGYFTPCYKFYIKKGEVETEVLQEDGTYIVPVYDVMYIKMTE